MWESRKHHIPRIPFENNENHENHRFQHENHEKHETLRNPFDNHKTNQNLRICIWVFFQRYKMILNDYKLNINMEDENNYLDEYFKLNKLNLKKKNYSFNY